MTKTSPSVKTDQKQKLPAFLQTVLTEQLIQLATIKVKAGIPLTGVELNLLKGQQQLGKKLPEELERQLKSEAQKEQAKAAELLKRVLQSEKAVFYNGRLNRFVDRGTKGGKSEAEVRASQMASHLRLIAELNSNQIEGPAGAQRNMTVNEDGMVTRRLLRVTGITENGVARTENVADRRTAEQVETVEMQKLVAKAVGYDLSKLRLSQHDKRQLDGTTRTAIIRDIVQQAMGQSLEKVPAGSDLRQLRSTPAYREAVAATAELIEIERQEALAKELAAISDMSTIDPVVGQTKAEDGSKAREMVIANVRASFSEVGKTALSQQSQQSQLQMSLPTPAHSLQRLN